MAVRKSGAPMRPASMRIDADWHVCQRMRDRRAGLGLTQQQMAELIGVTSQQAHKYETGLSRISAGRLYQIAEALGVEISYFFEDIEPERCAAGPNAQHRLLLELARDFAAIPNRNLQEAFCVVARALAAVEPEAENGASPHFSPPPISTAARPRLGCSASLGRWGRRAGEGLVGAVRRHPRAASRRVMSTGRCLGRGQPAAARRAW